MKINNIFWFVIDSVRNYSGTGDPRYRLKVMDEIKNDFFNFENAYTPAPSSIMSAAAMFTGKEAFKIARSYSDWEFDDKYPSIQKILKNLSFNIYPIDNSKRAREMLKDLIFKLDYKYYPRNISHSQNWTNSELELVFKNTINNIPNKNNNFFMCWLDCRGDYNTSNIVKSCLDFLKKKKMYDDSLIIMNSDHGYPDPKALSFEKIKGVRHDLVVTNDNIQVPLLIKIPGYNKTRSIKENVSLIDIFPTILELFNLRKNYKYDGELLIDLIEDNNKYNFERYIRTDTRLLLQKGKITSIVQDNKKFIYYHDTRKSELYDLSHDALELNDINDKEKKEEYRIILENSDNQIFYEHKNDLIKNLNKSLNKKITKSEKQKTILVLTSIESNFVKYLIKELKKYNLKIYTFEAKYLEQDYNFSEKEMLENYVKKNNKFDFSIILDEKNYYQILDFKFYNIAKKFSKKRVFLDTNFNLNNLFFNRWLYPLLKYKKNWDFYKHEPYILIKDILKLANILIQHYVFKKLVFTPRMEDLKLHRDQQLKADKDFKLSSMNYHYDTNIFAPDFSKFGGTQSQINLKINNLDKQKKINFTYLNNKKNFISEKDFSFKHKINITNLIAENTKHKNIIYKILSILFYSLIIKSTPKLFKRIVKGIKIRKEVAFIIKNSKINESYLTNTNITILSSLLFIRNIPNQVFINERNNILETHFKSFLYKKLYVMLAKKVLKKHKNVRFKTNSLITQKFFLKENISFDLTYNYPDKNYFDKKNFFLKENHAKFASIGRFVPQKNLKDLIQKMSYYLNDNNMSLLYLYGRGDKTYLKKIIVKNNIKNIIIDSYVSENFLEKIKNYNFFIINSKFEGQSNALLENIFLGKICICNDLLKKELDELYQGKFNEFVFFFKSQKELNEIIYKKITNLDMLNEMLKKQYNFCQSYEQNYLNVPS